jgi:hypothetical protein
VQAPAKPRFVENQQRGRTVKAFIEARKEVVQHGHDGGLAVHQLLHLEALHVGHAEPVMVGVQQLAVGTAEHIGRQRLPQRVRLQQHGKPRHRALLQRRTGEASQRRPDSRLLVGADRHAFMQQAALDPFGRPGAVAFAVDACQGLEGDFAISPASSRGVTTVPFSRKLAGTSSRTGWRIGSSAWTRCFGHW